LSPHSYQNYQHLPPLEQLNRQHLLQYQQQQQDLQKQQMLYHHHHHQQQQQLQHSQHHPQYQHQYQHHHLQNFFSSSYYQPDHQFPFKRPFPVSSSTPTSKNFRLNEDQTKVQTQHNHFLSSSPTPGTNVINLFFVTTDASAE
jgi:hypothetical protein